MAGPNQPGSRIVRDRFGRAWVVAYRNPDGSEYGSLLPQTGPASRHRSPGSHHNAHHHAHAVRPQLSGPSRSPSRTNGWSGEPVDPRDGMADNPLAQALFHSRTGQNQWDASYRFVRNATATYAALAFLAFFAPEVLSGSSFALRYSLNQAGAFGPAANRLFWSGSGYWFARPYGNQIGGYVGQTLEETPLGSFADAAQEFLPRKNWTGVIWSWLSRAYAEGAEDAALYFEGWGDYGPYQGKAWQTVESSIAAALNPNHEAPG